MNMTTPISWFVGAIKCLQGEGWQRIVVCSDGTDDELKPLSSIPGVVINRDSNALEDLMTLAHARLVIGSGSTFSAWGAFLAGSPLYVASGFNHFMSERFPVRETLSWDSAETHAAIRSDLGSLPRSDTERAPTRW
jgi:hypothetical protein